MAKKGKDKKDESALSVSKGVEQPPSVNPTLLKRIRQNRKQNYSADEYAEKIIEGNITFLSKAITLVESSRQDHYDEAQKIIDLCLPYSGNSVRLGITGVPGAGKSSFIETLGKRLCSLNTKLAVLAIDPSSEKSHGSILGDKTRMESLANDNNAFIRPSPSAGSLGGVARKTRESIILCEAAGFDTIFIETVGVGQSETLVHSMVDFFLLIMISGAGDELQGIKRGITEMADAIAINKADGANITKAQTARVEFQNALHFFPHSKPDWKPEVLTCSAQEATGIDEVWALVMEYISIAKGNGYFQEWRQKQAVYRMHDTINEAINKSFYKDAEISAMLPELEDMLQKNRITSYSAACKVLNKYFSDKGKGCF
ncbi:MAG: methylmalonyl Co-A mutase-associated GTPase MeaB [Bacteroidales bacterium]|nr:methylmalonyl Co-A mutase-associated GTPase MeaB [Bacteroidales bacterium]